MVPIKNTFVKTIKMPQPEINLSSGSAAYWSGHNEADGSLCGEVTEMADVTMSGFVIIIKCTKLTYR